MNIWAIWWGKCWIFVGKFFLLGRILVHSNICNVSIGNYICAFFFIQKFFVFITPLPQFRNLSCELDQCNAVLHLRCAEHMYVFDSQTSTVRQMTHHFCIFKLSQLIKDLALIKTIIGENYGIFGIQDTKSELSCTSLADVKVRTPWGSYLLVILQMKEDAAVFVWCFFFSLTSMPKLHLSPKSVYIWLQTFYTGFLFVIEMNRDDKKYPSMLMFLRKQEEM